MTVTQRRVLRSGTSLWAHSSGSSVPSAPLEVNLSTDVVVVGAGISGALMALTLTRHGHRVVVVDRRAPVHGSTLASTALLQFEIDTPLAVLGDRIGIAKASRAWQRSLAAVKALQSLTRREGIRCGMAERESLYLAGDAYGMRALKREAETRGRHQLPGAFLNAAELRTRYDLERTGAILSAGSAVANPAQLTAGLLRRACARGARIHSPVDVQDVHASRRGVELLTTSGHTLRTRDVVFCTGYELLEALPLSGHRVKSTWAIATRPLTSLPAWMQSTVVWEASDPYLYLRTTTDGRIIAGGEDEASATRHRDRRAMASKSATIARNVERLLPSVSCTPQYRWAGAFGESPSGLPILDGVPGLPHCHVVAGFGGNGITFSVIGADVIAGRIAGRKDPDADLFRAPT